MNSIFALVDCNAFYCSCEKLFTPSWENRPVVVLSSNDGIIVSLTPEAKALGIKRGDSFYQIKKLVENNKCAAFSSNFTLYADMSSRVMQTLATFSPQMEIYSIDEAFLNLHGLSDKSGCYLKYAREIKETVGQNTGIPVSIGIAKTKVLAKIAGRIAKKSIKAQGVVDLTDNKFHDIALARTPIEDIWGIGQALSRRLKGIGLHNALALRDYKNSRNLVKLTSKLGLQIQDELKGISCLPLEEFAAAKKEIISSRSFKEPINDLDQLRQSIARHVTTASKKLRNQNSVCFEITVTVRTDVFKNVPQYYNQASTHFYSGTMDTLKLVELALNLLDKIYKVDFDYKKTGIRLSQIRAMDQNQLSFFQDVDSFRDEELMYTMDKINSIYGGDTLTSAACGRTYKIYKGQFHSPCYTTSWHDLLRVK